MLPEAHRRIRSFVLRQGRQTVAQKKAFDVFWPKFGLSVDDGLFDSVATFGRRAPLIMDVGFGMGYSLLDVASRNPQFDFVGVEVYSPGVGSLLSSVDKLGLSNVRVFHHDVVEVLSQVIPDGCLSGVQLFFPDPWPKKRHHKRRLVQVEFVERIKPKLVDGGFFYFVSDWQHYSDKVKALLDVDKDFKEGFDSHWYHSLFEQRQATKFEQKGEAAGRNISEMFYLFS